jgi:hypothetical protein
MRFAFLFAMVSALAGCGGNVVVDASSTTGAGGSTVSAPLACGTTTCSVGYFCEDTPPGVSLPDGGRPPDSYACSAVPSSCASTPTCAYIDGALPLGDSCSTSFGGMCTADAAGNVTFVCVSA